jgi:hypothetical protein
MLPWHKRLLPFPILLALNACATSTMTQAVSDYCRIAQPIRYNSKLDSPKTVAAVEAHNSQYACVCDHDCPKGS